MSNENGAAGVAGEQTILSSNNGVLSLTNYRVKYDAKASGQSKYVSISLDNVSSCGLVTQSRPALLFIAAICAVLGLALNNDALIGMLVVAIAFVIAYLVTRTAVIRVSSNGGEGIAVPAKGMARQEIVAFLEAVTAAQLRFLGKLPAADAR